MALRVSVRLNGREIAWADIANISGLAPVSDYLVDAHETQSEVTGLPSRKIEGRIDGHERRQSVWALVAKAEAGRTGNYVIEWAGKPVLSVKRGLAFAAKEAGLGNVSPHVIRHSAAVHMAEAGIPMEEISQFLGHSDVEITRSVYARFSPNHLRTAAAALEYDDLVHVNRKRATLRKG